MTEQAAEEFQTPYEIMGDQGGWWEWMGGTQTGFDGTYDINGLPAGTYRWEVSGSTSAAFTLKVTHVTC